jgi:CBS-domain-containing membrane protein
VARLVDDVFLKVVPETSLGEILDMEAALDYAGHIGSRVARDIMSDPVSVRLDQTVRDAFAELKAHDLPGLPIVDAAHHVVGYLDQLEMLLVWVRATGRQRLLEPRAEQGS